MPSKRVAVLLPLLLTLSAFAQTPPLQPSYRPSLGRHSNYRLLLNGTVQLELGSVAGLAHFTATVDIEQRWQTVGGRLGCTLTVKGGTLRFFSAVGEQTQRLGRTSLLFVTTPLGELLEVRGSGAQSMEELTAELDLLATALASLLVPFPSSGVRIGEAWQAAHRFGDQIALTTVQCVEVMPPQSAVRLRLRYTLPLDTLVDPQVRTLWRLTARYAAESELLFGVAEGRTLSASGSIRLEASWQLPNTPSPQTERPPQQTESPSQPEQPPEASSSGSGASSSPEPSSSSTPPPSTPLSFQLRVDARFDLFLVR